MSYSLGGSEQIVEHKMVISLNWDLNSITYNETENISLLKCLTSCETYS